MNRKLLLVLSMLSLGACRKDLLDITSPDMRALIVHEAGHGIYAAAHPECKVVLLVINGNGDKSPYGDAMVTCSSEDRATFLRLQLALALAGQQAEMIGFGTVAPDQHNDLEFASRLVDDLIKVDPTETPFTAMQSATADVNATLRDHWEALRLVANKLASTDKLNGQQVAQIYAHAEAFERH